MTDKEAIEGMADCFALGMAVSHYQDDVLQLVADRILDRHLARCTPRQKVMLLQQVATLRNEDLRNGR